MSQIIDVIQVKLALEGWNGPKIDLKFCHFFDEDKTEILVCDESNNLYFLTKKDKPSAECCALCHPLKIPGFEWEHEPFWVLTGVHLPYGKMGYQKSIKVKGCIVLFYRLKNFSKGSDLMIATHKHKLLAYRLIESIQETSHLWSWGQNNWEWDVIREFLNGPAPI